MKSSKDASEQDQERRVVQTVEGAVVRNTDLIADSEKVMAQRLMMMMLMLLLSIWTARSMGTW